MKTLCRYNEKYSIDLEQRLKELNIKYEIKEILQSKRIIFNITKNFEQFECISSLLTSTPLIFKEFDKKDLEEANFLQIIPQMQKVHIENLDNSFYSSCKIVDEFGLKRTYHKQQVGNIAISKMSKDTCYFYSVDTGFSEIFVKSEVAQMVAENDIKGVSFRPVIESGKERNDLYQLWAEKELQFENMKFDGSEKFANCPLCSKYKSVIVENDYQLHLNLCENELDLDFYMTSALFGEGIPYRYYLISQKFYQLLKNEKLDKKVKFVPIVLNDM